MKRKGERKKSSLNVSGGKVTNKSTTENTFDKKRKLTGGRGRYFGMKVKEVEDDDKIKQNDANDSNDEGDSDMEAESDVEVGKHQDDDSGAGSSDDDDSGTDGDSEEKESDGDTRNSRAKGNDNDDSENDDEGSTGNENNSEEEDDDDDDDDESVENSEDETGNYANDSKTVAPSSKQKKLNKLNKQPNDSSVKKKGTKLTEKLPKFQGTTKASQQSQQTNSPARKRKKNNEDDIENGISSAKKSRACDDEKDQSFVGKRKDERDLRSLFLKDLPPSTTTEIVKKLSPEIISVRIPMEGKKNPRYLYAFVEFENEATAEKNYKLIKEKTIDNKKFTVDYCGEKSTYRKAPKEIPVNMKRLFIPGLPLDITADEIKQHFPEAKTYSSKQRSTTRLVFMSFENEAAAKKAFEENEKLTINGKKITVLYAYKKKSKVGAMTPRKRANIIPSIFEDEDSTETKDESKKILNESTETAKEGKKLKKKRKKKNSKMGKETIKMQ